MNRFRTLLQGLVRDHRNDERGATLVFVAAAMALLLPFSLAFAVEIGQDTVVNRSLQNAADAGAIDGARYLDVSPDNVGTIASEAVQTNYPGATSSVQQGSWTHSGGFVASITCESTSSCTAVKVTANGSVKHLAEIGSNLLSRSAVAVFESGTPPENCTTNCSGQCMLSSCSPVPGEAGFSIGTYLASINSTQSPVLNSLLGSLGSSVSLTAVGYEGLANTYVTVQNLIDASGGVLTPQNVLTTSLTGAQWNSFLLGAVTTQAGNLLCNGTPTPFPCTAKTSLTTLGGSVNGSTSARLCQLVSINGSTCSGGATASAVEASLNVYQLLTTEAELANGSNGLSVGGALNLGVLGSATMTVSLIQPPQVAFGPVGTTASTAQVNVDLKITLLPGLLGGSSSIFDLPITGADGTGTLANISCSSNTMTSTVINASTTAVAANITLLGVTAGGIKVTGVPSTGLSYTPPTNPVPPTTTSVDNGNNPQNIGSMSPNINLSLLGLGLPLSVLGLGSTLAPLLQVLGVNVGGAQVADLSTLCDPVTLGQ